jgi:hypothetical protein
MSKGIWRGSYFILLSTPTAVKLAEVTPWIHHSGLKPAASTRVEWSGGAFQIHSSQKSSSSIGNPSQLHGDNLPCFSHSVG